MHQQFLQIASELEWDLDTQIERLDEFVRVYGAAGRMDAELSEIGLAVQQRLHREALREAMLNFIDRLGAAGAFSHFLQRQLRRAHEALAPQRGRDATTLQPRASVRGIARAAGTIPASSPQSGAPASWRSAWRRWLG